MNFLAHIYLSGDDSQLKIGNFIADRVRGSQYQAYPLRIQQGILLHREIDSYTDFHPIFRKSKKKLVPQYNHYSGVIVDVFYDHFLAKNWFLYSDTPLTTYANDFYLLLEQHIEVLPPQIQKMLPIMVDQNWLVSYQTISGICQILTQMDKRTDNQSKMRFSTSELQQYYEDFESEFTLFFEEIQNHLIAFRKEKGF